MNKDKTFNVRGSISDLLIFMCVTIDGWVALIISVIYFFWGFGSLLGFFSTPDDVDSLALLIFSFVIVVVFIWHRKDSHSNELMKSFFCIISVLAVASIPLSKLMREMM